MTCAACTPSTSSFYFRSSHEKCEPGCPVNQKFQIQANTLIKMYEAELMKFNDKISPSECRDILSPILEEILAPITLTNYGWDFELKNNTSTQIKMRDIHNEIFEQVCLKKLYYIIDFKVPKENVSEDLFRRSYENQALINGTPKYQWFGLLAKVLNSQKSALNYEFKYEAFDDTSFKFSLILELASIHGEQSAKLTHEFIKSHRDFNRSTWRGLLQKVEEKKAQAKKTQSCNYLEEKKEKFTEDFQALKKERIQLETQIKELQEKLKKNRAKDRDLFNQVQDWKKEKNKGIAAKVNEEMKKEVIPDVATERKKITVDFLKASVNYVNEAELVSDATKIAEELENYSEVKTNYGLQLTDLGRINALVSAIKEGNAYSFSKKAKYL